MIIFIFLCVSNLDNSLPRPFGSRHSFDDRSLDHLNDRCVAGLRPLDPDDVSGLRRLSRDDRLATAGWTNVPAGEKLLKSLC